MTRPDFADRSKTLADGCRPQGGRHAEGPFSGKTDTQASPSSRQDTGGCGVDEAPGERPEDLFVESPRDDSLIEDHSMSRDDHGFALGHYHRVLVLR
jgi:hypothetical protein